ncbi:MAG: prevent-host-death protein [Candidatus Competibacteraceae bacterium]|nr:prevent-host-death protein [Candidatus Competibacteraceae bacterium]
MKTMTVGEFKSQFSKVLEAVQAGESVAVCYGRNHRKVAVMVPYANFKLAEPRPLGPLKGKVQVAFAKDFSLDDETLLAS